MISYDDAQVLFILLWLVTVLSYTSCWNKSSNFHILHTSVTLEKSEFFFSIVHREETRGWQSSLMLMLQLSSAFLPKIKLRSNFLGKGKYQLFFFVKLPYFIQCKDFSNQLSKVIFSCPLGFMQFRSRNPHTGI